MNRANLFTAAFAAVIINVLNCTIDTARAHEWTGAREPIDRQFSEQLELLASRCDELGLQREAELTRGWQVRRSPGRIYLFLPPAKAPEPVGEDGSPSRFWFQRFLQLRREHAEKLFQLAREAARQRPDWAYQLAHEVLREDPQHSAARQALAYRQVEDRWVYGGDEISTAVGSRAMKEYGFVAGQYLRIDSANFRILTNADEDTGRQMAARLEELHCAWRQLFFEYWGSGALLERRFEHGAPDARPRVEKHRVVWFGGRDQYLASLSDDEPLIEKTLGIYLDKQRTVYMYGDPANTLTNWLHEVTHQLFAEHGRTHGSVGANGHIWIVEGIALFMESLWWHGDYCTVGGADAERLQFARYRALNDNFHVPLAELTLLDRQAIQNDERIGALYSQSAGLAHFLMTGGGGELRPGLVQYLTDVYQGSRADQLLPNRTQRGYGELDHHYRAFLSVTDNDLNDCYPVESLYLGHCAVSDAGLRKIPLDHLSWLDVGFTSVSDAGLEHLQSAKHLKRLTIEHTQVTAAGLQHLRGLEQLEYLDVSGLPLDDRSLMQLAGFPNLEALWLTDTGITDEGLLQLAVLKKLKTLDVSGTRVTPAGFAQLKSALPALQE